MKVQLVFTEAAGKLVSGHVSALGWQKLLSSFRHSFIA